jgi:hypothetical protein
MQNEQLLQTKLCDLQLNLKDSWVKPYIEKLKLELSRKGITFKPSIWISDDWFSPDGTTGFAIPFFLLRKDLIHLEQKMVGYAEGSSAKDLMMLLRHETAHALDNGFHLRKKKTRQALFGKTSRKYPTSYIPCIESNNYVEHLPDHYAQSHPDEDWAETFAVWLDPRSQWNKKYAHTNAYKKLLCVDQIMEKLPSQKCFNRSSIDNITSLDLTLEQYYKEKIKRLKLKEKSPLYTVVKDQFAINGKRCAVKYISQNRQEILRKLAKNTGLPHNKTISIINELKTYCKEEKLFMSYHKNVDSLTTLLSCPKIINHQKRVIM